MAHFGTAKSTREYSTRETFGLDNRAAPTLRGGKASHGRELSLSRVDKILMKTRQAAALIWLTALFEHATTSRKPVPLRAGAW